jgi:hypothetical protein
MPLLICLLLDSSEKYGCYEKVLDEIVEAKAYFFEVFLSLPPREDHSNNSCTFDAKLESVTISNVPIHVAFLVLVLMAKFKKNLRLYSNLGLFLATKICVFEGTLKLRAPLESNLCMFKIYGDLWIPPLKCPLVVTKIRILWKMVYFNTIS